MQLTTRLRSADRAPQGGRAAPAEIRDFQLWANLTRREIPSLNGIRAFAVLSVILYHLDHRWAPGPHGVICFFVLSGFLITHLLLTENASTDSISLPRFFSRRGLRLLPAFYFSCALFVGVSFIMHIPISPGKRRFGARTLQSRSPKLQSGIFSAKIAA